MIFLVGVKMRVKPCVLVVSYRVFRGACRLHFQEYPSRLRCLLYSVHILVFFSLLSLVLWAQSTTSILQSPPPTEPDMVWLFASYTLRDTMYCCVDRCGNWNSWKV